MKYCPNCGAENTDESRFCHKCGFPLTSYKQELQSQQQNNLQYQAGFNNQNQQRPPKPPNHLLGAILTLLFCCMPLGIVSLIYSTQVDSKYNMGDYQGAIDASNKAKNWMIAAIISGIVLTVFYVFGLIITAIYGG